MTTLDEARSSFSKEIHIARMLNNQRWNQLTSLKLLNLGLSIKQVTAKKHKNDEINQYTNGCESFHRENAMFGLSRVWRQFFNLENNTFTNSDRSTSNTRLTRVVLYCKCAHSAHWLTHLARYKNRNSISIVNVISIQNRILTN